MLSAAGEKADITVLSKVRERLLSTIVKGK
jgi:hypothetical protein